MWFIPVGQAINFMSQKSYQNHQMNMVTKVCGTIVTTVVTTAVIGAMTYLAGKRMEEKSE